MREPSKPEDTPKPRSGLLQAMLGILGLAMFAVILSAPANLMENNENRVAAYVWDAVKNGNWIFQVDLNGGLASKPPLYTWLASLATLGFGTFNRIAIYLPSALATVATALVLCAAGGSRFGWAAGFLAGLSYLLSHIGEKQMVMARYDGLFGFMVLLAALAAFRAWTLGRGWVWFWLAAAGATMTKGPLGLVLGGSGLLAALWEKRSGHRAPIRGPHLGGIVVFVAITCGWFIAAWIQIGQPLIDKLILAELITHAVSSDEGGGVGSGFYKPTLAFLGGFAPWSLFACAGLWRVWRHPASDSEERRFERFLFCAFFAGLIVFSLAAHQRTRLVLPLVPIAALLGGRELAVRLSSWTPGRLLRAAALLAVGGLGVVGGYSHFIEGRGDGAEETARMRRMAIDVGQKLGGPFPVSHVDSPFPLQYYLHTMRPMVSHQRAALLLQGELPAFVAVVDWETLAREPGLDTNRVHELGRWPGEEDTTVRIVSNHSKLERTDRVAGLILPFYLELDGVESVRAEGGRFEFKRLGPGASIVIANESDVPRMIKVLVEGREEVDVAGRRVLGPGERWNRSWPP